MQYDRVRSAFLVPVGPRRRAGPRVSADAKSSESGPGRREVERGSSADGETSAEVDRASAEVDRASAEVDRASAEVDRASAEVDRASAEADQTASDIDQGASERDQRASDRDQAAADIDRAESDGTGDSGASWAGTRRARTQSTIERDIAAHARVESSRGRDHVAELRDRAARERDAAADARDKLAAALDAEMAELEAAAATGGDAQDGARPEVLQARRLATGARERAASARAAAAHDRQAARADRRRAAVDRETANAELALEGADYLTGALRRRAGLRALTRELARARRAQQPLLVAFVDVDGLKAINDAHGHAAGDAVLRAVATSLQDMLRGYDVVVRYGGDEFVCILCGQSSAEVSNRFESLIADFVRVHDMRLSVGFAESDADELPEQLIARADAAMIAAREDRQGHHR
jgi:diguanylate cyclase (GGDEF)-like protein